MAPEHVNIPRDDERILAMMGAEQAQEEPVINEPEEAVTPDEEVVNEAVEVAEVPAENESASEDTEETRKDLIEDPNDPLANMDAIRQMMTNAQQLVEIMKDQWMASAKELQLTDDHMKELAKWNDDHKTPIPEGISDEERSNWDHLNGIDSITEEEVERIFGPKPHPIYGVMHSQTVDRIKGACNDFFGWLSTLREYRNIHDAFLELLELEEEKNIEVLREISVNESDPDKRAVMERSISNYYDLKYLGFMSDTLTDKDRDMILKALTDAKKIEYWRKRSMDKLRQLKIDARIILELWQFERRFLEEKYWRNSNILVMYFMKTCVYSNPGDKNDMTRSKVMCMVIALDGIIRNTWTGEKRERVLNNIRAFEDRFLPYIKEVDVDPTLAPPITEESTGDSNDVQA